MKHFQTIVLLLLSIGLLFTCCSDKAINADKWYEDTKAEILKQSALKADSIVYTYNGDSTFKNEYHYSAGHVFFLNGYRNGVFRLEIHYSKDGKFELRREIHNSGSFGFEGIVYQSNFYGLSTWRYPDGKIHEQGIRYKGESIGVWKKYDKTGKLIGEDDYRNMDKLDDLPIIEK
jgi:antitoxin component YwqK of YwqJK toxin-antitoxin module